MSKWRESIVSSRSFLIRRLAMPQFRWTGRQVSRLSCILLSID